MAGAAMTETRAVSLGPALLLARAALAEWVHAVARVGQVAWAARPRSHVAQKHFATMRGSCATWPKGSASNAFPRPTA